MLITFSSKVYPDVVMFGNVATVLLRAMGQKEEPPGILRGEDIRIAAERLRAHLDIAAPRAKADADDDDPNKTEDERKEARSHVGLRTRAIPLLEMMDVCYRKEADLIWR